VAFAKAIFEYCRVRPASYGYSKENERMKPFLHRRIQMRSFAIDPTAFARFQFQSMLRTVPNIANERAKASINEVLRD
jgi:hypothetical protein